jgi:integrase
VKDSPFYYLDGNGVKQKIPKSKPNQRDTKLSINQIKTLIDKASPAVRLRLFHVAFTGKRKSEILKTEWQHLDLENHTWFIPKQNSKSKRDSTVPIPKQLVEEFKRYQVQTGQIAGLIHPKCNFNRELHTLEKRSQIPVNVTPHVFRHSFASHWRGSPQVLMGLLGWTSPVMIQRYTHLNAEDLRREAEQKGITSNLGL